MDLLSDFAISQASMVGREHLRLHRNNQDAVQHRASTALIAGVVCDGCGEGRGSEAGARLCAAFVTDWLCRCAPGLGSAEKIAHAATSALTAWLWRLAEPFDDPARRAAFVRDHLLATLIACVIEEERTVVFGVGDGVFSVNGQTTRLDAGADNAPAYPAYRIVDRTFMEGFAESKPVILYAGPTRGLQSLLIGTDGLDPLAGRGELAQLEEDGRYAKNPTLLQRRFVVLGERGRAFGDDATALLIQRRQEV